MKVTVTPVCRHKAEGMRPAWYGQGESFVGKRLVVNADVAMVDGKPVIMRDRRPKKERPADHNWYTVNNHPDPQYRRINWTGFTVEVEP